MALTAIDRCDSNQSEQALVSVTNTPNKVPSLFFCGHHFTQYWTILMATGWEIVDDQRYALELAEAGHSQGGDHA